MARSFLCGFELGSVGEFFATTGTAPTIQTGTVRSGTYAMRANPTAAQSYAQFRRRNSTGTFSNLFQSVRFWLRIATLPSANTHIAESFGVSLATVHQFLQLNTDGKLAIGQTASVEATSTDVLSADGLWHLVELEAGASGKNLWVDGSLWASGGANGVQDSEGRLGVITSTTADLYFDDVEWWNSDLGGASLYVTHKHKIILSLPTADSSITSWTGGAGGTTNLFDAVNNVPPVGVSAETNTSQIKSSTSTGAAQYTATMQSYSVAGVRATDTVDAVMAIANHGELVGTGTKTGSLTLVSNPAVGATTFDFGDDVGAVGTFPTNWKTHPSGVADSPSVTLGTAPTVKIIKTDTGTREADCDFIGLYIDYTPAPSLVYTDRRVARNSLLRR